MVILDRKVTIELPAAGRDATGGAASGPARESRYVWAAVNETGARETMVSGREDSATLATVTINYREGFDNRWQVLIGVVRYRVLGVNERDGRRFLDVLCEAVR